MELRFTPRWSSLFCALLSTWFLVSSSKAQELHLKHIAPENGLLSTLLFDVIQDTNGYLWFGGLGSVVKSSGYSFTPEPFENESTPVSFGFYSDQHKRLWSYGELGNLHVRERGKFRSIDFEGLGELIPNYRKYYVNNLCIDAEDTIRLSLTNPSNQILVAPDSTVLFRETETNGQATFSISDFGDGLSYFKKACDTYVDSIIIELDGKRIVVRCSAPERMQNTGYRVIKTSNHNYLLSTGRHLIHFNHQGVVNHLTFDDNLNNALLEDSRGNIWVGTNKGAWFFQDGILDQRKAKRFLEKQVVYKVFEDHEGGIWISCAAIGIQYAANPSVMYYPDKTFEGNRISALHGSEGKVYLGTNQPEIYILEGDSIRPLQIGISGKDRTIRSIARKSTGELWFSTQRGTYELVGGKAILRNSGYAVITIDKDDNVWAGKLKGLVRIDSTGTSFDSKEIGFSERVASLRAGRGDTIWLKTNTRGLMICTQDTILPYPQNTQDSSAYPSPTKLHGIHNRMPILSSNNTEAFYKGSNRIDLTECQSSLSNKEAWRIAQHQSTWWVTSQAGITRFDLDTTNYECLNSKEYGSADGFSGRNFSGIFIDNDRLVASSDMGLNIAPLSALRGNPHPPKVQFSGLNIGRRDTFIQPHYDLDYSQNFLTFRFEGMSYKRAGKLDFKYRMEGVDDDWIISKEPTTQYTTLPPGDYTFKVYAANNDGVWSTEPATMHFSIAPPYWQTWWFRTLMLAVLVGLIWLGFTIRFRNLRVQMQLKEQSLEAQQKALRAQMTPHFMFNALNSIQLLISDNERVFAIKNVSKFARLMRKVLHSSDKAFVPLTEEIEALDLYLELESLRFDGKFSYQLKQENVDDPAHWKVPSMIIQPFVENAIWHGIMKKIPQEGHVEVSFSTSNQELHCRITDNGVGRSRAARIEDLRLEGGSSKGMQLIEDRIKALNGQFKINIRFNVEDLVNDSNEASGTQVHIIFPYFKYE